MEGLKIKCEKCGTESDSTRTRFFERYYTAKIHGLDSKDIKYDNQDLCDGCYDSTLQQLYAEVKEAREKNGWIES